MVESEQSLDGILGGALRILQPRRGYRFSVEAVLLARFISPRVGARLLDLGAGCGVIALAAAKLYRPREVVALELQEHLAALIARNAALNRIEVVRALAADLRARRIPGVSAGSFDYAIANPPFFRAGSGRESPLSGRRMARGGAGAGLDEFVAAAARYLKSGGKAGFVLNAARGAELLCALRKRRLEPKRMRMVYPRAGQGASTFLVEARKDGGVGLDVEPPLMLYQGPGVLSEEARALLERIEPEPAT